MKKDKYIKVLSQVVILFICVTTFFSCDSIESIHEQYLTGETIYAGKLSKIAVHSGFGRVKIGASTEYLGVSELCIIEWEDNKKEFSISKNEKDTFEFIIDGLEERGYEFKITAKDKQGNASVEQIVAGKALGKQFLAAQRGRSIKNFDIIGTILEPICEVSWTDAELNENIVETIFSYEKTDGTRVTSIISSNENKTPCYDMRLGSKAEIKTKIKSGKNGIDTISIPVTEVELPKEAIMKVPGSGLRVKPYPGESGFDDYYGWNKMFNEIVNPNDAGESSIGCDNGFPQDHPTYLTIDLGFICKLSYFKIWQRGGGLCLYRDGNPINYEVYGAEEYPEYNQADPLAGWTLLRACKNSKPSGLPMGETNTDDINFQTTGEQFDFDAGIKKTRYIRFKFKDIYEPDKHYVAIGELAFWAKAGI